MANQSDGYTRVTNKVIADLEQGKVPSPALYQRADDGYPIGADDRMRDGYGPIPDAAWFHHGATGTAQPETVHGWRWSSTFGCWTALVTFPDGWHGFTYPAPAPTPAETRSEAPGASETTASTDVALERLQHGTRSHEAAPEDYEQQRMF